MFLNPHSSLRKSLDFQIEKVSNSAGLLEFELDLQDPAAEKHSGSNLDDLDMDANVFVADKTGVPPLSGLNISWCTRQKGQKPAWSLLIIEDRQPP